jgi:hypothetical protein
MAFPYRASGTPRPPVQTIPPRARRKRVRKLSWLWVAAFSAALNGCDDVDINTAGDRDEFRYGQPARMWLSDDGTALPADADVTWTSDRDGEIGRGGDITVDGLTPGRHRIRINGNYNGEEIDADRRLTVENDDPEPQIIEPTRGRDFAIGETIRFSGSATDTEDGAIAPETLRWTSSIAGELGTGPSLSVSDLHPGEHKITLSATDRAGATGTTTLKVEVVNEAPEVEIDRPGRSTRINVGESITFKGSATDPDPLHGSSSLPAHELRWTSNKDGDLGAGPELTVRNLSGGEHKITLTAKDEFGKEGKSEVRVEVINREPRIRVRQPNDNTFFSVRERVRFEAQVTDPDGFPIDDDDIVWHSNKDGRIGRGRSFRTDELTGGRHEITVRATDRHGATTEKKITIQMNNDAPTASITSPRSGAEFNHGEDVTFEGRAEDAEDGRVANDRLEWKIVRDGENRSRSLGRGRRVTTDDLPFGTHRVTLAASDRDGEVSEEVTITITIRNRAPQVRITSPASGLTVSQGDEVLLSGSAFDPDRDRFLERGNLKWTASYAGTTRELGQGTEVRVSDLAPGAWTITLTAIDPDQASVSSQATVTVNVGGGVTASNGDGSGNQPNSIGLSNSIGN